MWEREKAYMIPNGEFARIDETPVRNRYSHTFVLVVAVASALTSPPPGVVRSPAVAIAFARSHTGLTKIWSASSFDPGKSTSAHVPLAGCSCPPPPPPPARRRYLSSTRARVSRENRAVQAANLSGSARPAPYANTVPSSSVVPRTTLSTHGSTSPCARRAIVAGVQIDADDDDDAGSIVSETDSSEWCDAWSARRLAVDADRRSAVVIVVELDAASFADGREERIDASAGYERDAGRIPCEDEANHSRERVKKEKEFLCIGSDADKERQKKN